MTRIIEHVQWAYSALVQPTGGMVELAGPPFTFASEVFPYTVPENRWLAICAVSMASKFGGSGRASYLCVDNCFTLPDNAPSMNWGTSPFVVPPSKVLNARFFNNETMTPDYGVVPGGEAQWMNMTMTGILVDHQPGMTVQTCLDGVFL